MYQRRLGRKALETTIVQDLINHKICIYTQPLQVDYRSAGRPYSYIIRQEGKDPIIYDQYVYDGLCYYRFQRGVENKLRELGIVNYHEAMLMGIQANDQPIGYVQLFESNLKSSNQTGGNQGNDQK